MQRKAEVSWERWWVFGEEGWGVEVVLVGKEGVRGFSREWVGGRWG